MVFDKELIERVRKDRHRTDMGSEDPVAEPRAVRDLDEGRSSDEGARDMSLAYHPLPAARRTVDDQLARYVRAEYCEKDACWFVSGAKSGTCSAGPAARLPGSATLTSARRAEVARPQTECCGTRSAIPETNILKRAGARSGASGDR